MLIRNSSKILASLEFTKKELDNWYDLIRKVNNQRVSLIHNNLSTDHYLKKDKSYLISWDNAKIDTPVLDLVTLYKNEYFYLDFNTLFEEYKKKNPLSKEDEKLFFILISLVPEVISDVDEFKSVKNARDMLDYLYITENLIRPYYTIEEEKQ